MEIIINSQILEMKWAEIFEKFIKKE